MTITFKQLANGTVPSTAAAVYTASAANAQIDACALTNNSASTVATVSLWVTAGGSPTDQNLILKNYSIPAGTTKRAWEVGGQVVPNGASLYAKASVDAIITLVAGGREQATS